MGIKILKVTSSTFSWGLIYGLLVIFSTIVGTLGSNSTDAILPDINATAGRLNTTYYRDISSSIEYVFQYTLNMSSVGPIANGDIRIKVTSSEDADPNEPILFVVRHQKEVLSWQLPVVSKFNHHLYHTAGRTLCNAYPKEQEDIPKIIYVSVSTSSKKTVSFSLTVSVEPNFIMALNQTATTEISPQSPRYFKFDFPHAASKYVLLEVFSSDDTCITVSVQNVSCPVFDQESNVEFEGYWQTMSLKAGMTVQKDEFPLGFFVVFVMHSDDSACTKTYTDKFQYSPDRTKKVNFVVREKITSIEYLTAIFGTIGIFFIFYLFSFVVSCAYLCKNSQLEVPIDDDDHNAIHNHSSTSLPNPSSRRTNVMTGIPEEPESSSPLDSPRLPDDNGNNETQNADPNTSDSTHWLMDTDSSLDETDIDMLEDANRDKDVYRATTMLSVAAMAKKNPRVLAKKTQMYLWTLFTVAIFYALPVVQLVFTYQNVLHTTGNQDLCYYNFLCSHPLWMLSDFNHVYSNIGYIMLGFLFLLLVLRRDRMHQTMVARCPAMELHFGIPKHYGLFYAMGFALMMEGVLSACYHVCPNHSNFQFDTCFMYVNAILCMLKIYQTRHPDINASAYMAFASLAFVVLIGVVGVMDGSLYFWICFTTLHVMICLFLSIQIYYLGRWKLDIGVFQRIYNTWRNDFLASPLLCLKPLYVDRMVLLVMANLANWGIAGYGVYRMPHDFASHLLLIFMANLSLYTLFYIVMKLTHREKIQLQPAIYIILSIVFWSLSLYVFIHRSTSWQLSPAQSRTYNRECILLRFYDTHDIWHFLSAVSLFFSFMVMLTLDDDRIHVRRTKIAVF